MKSLKIYIAFSLVLFMSKAYAQSDLHNLGALSWEISFPAGNNYLTESSLAGGRVEFRKMINPRFSAGLAFSWNSFDQYVGKQTYKTPSGFLVTTDMVREIYTAPITAIGHYYPEVGSKMFKPYVGVGLGAQYAEQNAYFNIYQITNDNWGFVVRPEIGVLVEFNHSVGALLTLSYNYSTNKNKAFDMNSLQQFGINIGVAGLF